MSGIIARIDAKFFHPGQESRPVHTQARRSSVRPSHSSLRFGERLDDLITLFFGMIAGTAAVPMQRADGLLYDTGNIIVFSCVFGGGGLGLLGRYLAQLS